MQQLTVEIEALVIKIEAPELASPTPAATKRSPSDASAAADRFHRRGTADCHASCDAIRVLSPSVGDSGASCHACCVFWRKRLRAAAAVHDGAERPAADDRGHGRESDEKGSRGWRDSVEQQEGKAGAGIFCDRPADATGAVPRAEDICAAGGQPERPVYDQNDPGSLSAQDTRGQVSGARAVNGQTVATVRVGF